MAWKLKMKLRNYDYYLLSWSNSDVPMIGVIEQLSLVLRAADF